MPDSLPVLSIVVPTYHEVDNIALLTERIRYMTGHIQTHKKDFSSRRGLLKMVGRRNSLLKYLVNNDRQRYLGIIGKLGLRK